MEPKQSGNAKSRVHALGEPNTKTWFSLRAIVIVLIAIVAAQWFLIRSLIQAQNENINNSGSKSSSQQLCENAPISATDIPHSAEENTPTAHVTIPSSELLKIGQLFMLHQVIFLTSVSVKNNYYFFCLGALSNQSYALLHWQI